MAASVPKEVAPLVSTLSWIPWHIQSTRNPHHLQVGTVWQEKNASMARQWGMGRVHGCGNWRGKGRVKRRVEIKLDLHVNWISVSNMMAELLPSMPLL